MNSCPVCFSEIQDHAIKCPHCLTFIKPRTNEGQFWGTCLMVAGILIGIFSYIWFLAEADNIRLQFMDVGIFLAYFGFLIYGFGTFRSWFHLSKLKDEEMVDQDRKKCFFCGSIIDSRAIKCCHCYSYLRQERGKILATFGVVSGILIVTTAYIMFLANKLKSETYMQVGLYVILAGIIVFLLLVIRRRYAKEF